MYKKSHSLSSIHITWRYESSWSEKLIYRRIRGRYTAENANCHRKDNNRPFHRTNSSIQSIRE